MKHRISLQKAKMLILPKAEGSSKNQNLALALNAEFMNLGFMMSEELFGAVASMEKSAITQLHNTVLPILNEMIGNHVKHKPMYKGFPQEVHDMSYYELYLNAIRHYWSTYGDTSNGTWMPASEDMPRELAFESIDYIAIKLGDENDFMRIFSNIVGSNTSISDLDKAIVQWFINTYGNNLEYPDMPFKENLCYVTGLLLEKGKSIEGVCKTATDILRVVTVLSGGDVSLSDNTKFISLPRSKRRLFVEALEECIRAEDIKRHQSKWVRLFHSLHIGDFAKKAPKTFEIAQLIRNGGTITTVQSMIEAILNPEGARQTPKRRDKSAKVSNKWLEKHFDVNASSDLVEDDAGDVNVDETRLLKLLSTRPGEFARRLDQLIRAGVNVDLMIEYFKPVVSKVSTRVLLQVFGHFKNRDMEQEHRVVFPKGSLSKAMLIPANEKFETEDVAKVMDVIMLSLKERFSNEEGLGKIYIDPNLQDCPVPMAQRNDSIGLFTAARGTRFPIGEDKNTLRFFVYWKGRDIDLSATLHDKDFNMIERIAYTNLKSGKYEAAHSGDITSAPNGASEFIDITIDKAAKSGARYVAMNVLVYSGPTFAEHEECFAGFMTREHPKSNEIFDPKTVAYKVNLTQPVSNMIPLIFDLVERKAIFVDMPTARNTSWGGNNVESNKANIMQILKAVTSLEDKVNLYELFTMHSVRGTLVEDPAEADHVFSLTEGVTPYDVDTISAEFMK